MAPTKSTERAQHRDMTRGLRDNAGIDLREDVVAVADFGAAARRLRASVRGAGVGGADDALRRRPVRPSSAASATVSAVAPASPAADIDLRRAEFASRAADLLALVDVDAGEAAVVEPVAAAPKKQRSSVVLRVGRRLAAR